MRAKPVIAVDCADVIVPLIDSIAKYYSVLKNTTLTDKDFYCYSFERVWNTTQDEATRVIEAT